VAGGSAVGAGHWIWAIPSVFDYAAQHQGVHALEHATLFYTGLAMWWLIIDPLPRAPLAPQRSAAGAAGLHAPCQCLRVPAADLDLDHRVPALRERRPRYGISAINDQHLAGASMCFIEALVFGIAFAAVHQHPRSLGLARPRLANTPPAPQRAPADLAAYCGVLATNSV